MLKLTAERFYLNINSYLKECGKFPENSKIEFGSFRYIKG